MCGIAGILTADRVKALAAVSAMNGALEHRGPDDDGAHLVEVGDRWLALGNRRLAMLDTSKAGHQPMIDRARGDVITYNGEIYSLAAQREGGSDTAVLLRELQKRGDAALRALDGMFAFAWYSPDSETLTLARDPAGIKPLYFVEFNGCFLFASEVRALLATGLVDRTIDRAGLASYLAYGAMQEPLTLYRKIRSIEPGTALKIRATRPVRIQIDRFWSPPDTAPRADAVEAVRGTLRDQVRSHLASDRPIGVYLSSGIDSTILTGLAAEAGDVRSFTVRFDPGDEGPIANRTAERFGTKHCDVRVEESGVLQDASDWLDRIDLPSIDGLNTFIVSRAARREGIVAALSGLGGDELFGGYPSFREVPQICARLARMRWLPAGMRRAAAGVVAAGAPATTRQKAMDMAGTSGELTQIYLHRRRLISDRGMQRLGFEAKGDHMPAGSLPDVSKLDDVAAVARLEFATYMRSMLLRDADSVSMASSLELRVPLLSRPMLDLMLSINGPTLLPPGQPLKHLAREAFRDLLPDEVLSQEKQGFALPIGRWMAGPLRERCETSLARLKESELMRPEGVGDVWRRFELEPESPAWSRAWALVVLGATLQT